MGNEEDSVRDRLNTISRATIEWLLEPADIGVRYLTMRDLMKVNDSQLTEVMIRAHRDGPIAEVLAKMHPKGYWQVPGPGYNPKYTSTVWSIILLGQLGAHIKAEPRVATACKYVLDHTFVKDGQLSASGTASGTADCLQGNLCAALLDLGYQDTRLDKAFEWMARTVTGEGIASMNDRGTSLRYYAGKCGPNFACGANNKLPCAWGAAKVMLAFARLPVMKRTPVIDRAIKAGIDFLFSKDPAEADYPSGYAGKPSGNWWRFGFPVFYVTDILQIGEALAGLGYARDPRLTHTMEVIQQKQNPDGRWMLDYDYTGKTWVDFGPKKQPNKWVTLRALRVLAASMG